jgi:hypothetical protein
MATPCQLIVIRQNSVCLVKPAHDVVMRPTRSETDAIDAILIGHLQRRVRRSLRDISAAEQAICRVRHANDRQGCEIESPVDLSNPDLPIDPASPPPHDRSGNLSFFVTIPGM